MVFYDLKNNLRAFVQFAKDIKHISDIKGYIFRYNFPKDYKFNFDKEYETDIVPYYWANGSNEVDFIYQHGMNVIPLEVKAEINLKSRSLMGFCRKYKIPFAIRASMIDYRRDLTDTIPTKGNTENAEFKFILENLPLYAISCIEQGI